MKLIIQIPCLNERDQLARTLEDLPRELPGVDQIEVLIVDDGSSDDTSEHARELGVHHIVRFPSNRGLSAAFMAGLDACVRLGADVIVNTDADNQYCADDIVKLVAPILAGDADVVVGDRRVESIEHFSFVKRVLQKWGSGMVRRASGTGVRDSTSGFRAMSRKAAYQAFVHNRFTYTLEALIQAGRTGLTVVDVDVRTNPVTRKSRLFKSIPAYLRRNGPVIVRSYAMYRPAQTFSLLALLLALPGVLLIGRFLYFYLQNPEYSGYVQSLIVGVGFIILGFLVALLAFLSDLLAANRRLTEEVLMRVRRLDARLAQVDGSSPEFIVSTGEAPWRPRTRDPREPATAPARDSKAT